MRKARNFGTPNLMPHLKKYVSPEIHELLYTCFFLTRQSVPLISWGPFLWSVVSSSACAFTWVRPCLHHQSAFPLFDHNGENVFRMQMIKGFGGILGILVSCKDLWRQFTTGKSPIVILTCNIWVSIQPWVDDTGDIGTTRPTNHPREIDSCVEGMLPSLLEQQMEESDYL